MISEHVRSNSVTTKQISIAKRILREKIKDCRNAPNPSGTISYTIDSGFANFAKNIVIFN